MRYVIFNYVHPDDVAVWEAWTPDEQAADVARHQAWFGRWREHVVGGEELDLPRTVKTLRPGRQGEGITALAMAREWPSLASQAQTTVQVQPVHVRE